VRLDLVEIFRCPRAHAPASLIAAVDAAVDGDVTRGVLGCPVCDVRYPIIAGAVVFDERLRAACLAAGPAPRATPDAALRTAALLDLTGPGGRVLLGGTAVAAADALAALVDVAIVALDPPGPTPAAPGGVAVYAGAAPLGPAVLRGAVLDGETAGAAPTVIAALRPGARLLAPVALAMPAGVRPLARDAEHWLAERTDDGAAAVPLRRAAPAVPAAPAASPRPAR